MKRILFLLALVSQLYVNGQIITGATGRFRTSLELAGYKVTSISNDSAMAGNSATTIPTQYAVKNLVANYVNSRSLPSQGGNSGKYLTTNGTVASWGTITPTAPSGSSGQVQYNNSGAFGALDSFTVSANPDRLGIGVPTPTARLDIQGSGSTSATNALRIRNSAGTALMTLRNDGQLQVNSNTDASKSSLLLSGTGFSGGTATTTKPTLLIEPTGTTSTGWSTSGTKLGVNAESGFTGRLLDLQVNGVSQANFLANGNLRIETGSLTTVIGNIYAGGEIYSGTYLGVTNRFSINSPSDGIITLRNYAATDLNRVNFGGTTASFPAIKRNGAGLDIRLADDSGYAPLVSSKITVGSASANTNAIIEANSTSKGFLPPRMTTTQRDAVTWVTGDAGMIIFNTTLVKLQVWNGTAWETITSI